MEKLIELLNEYGEYQYYLEDGKLQIERADNYVIDRYIELEIISKRFGFIKWLVDNDKINLKKANNIDTGPLFDYYSDEDALIMALSINDEPLEFLISILK